MLKSDFLQGSQYIHAEPSRRNRYTATGPDFIDIIVTYVSMEIDASAPIEGYYPMKRLQFDDQNLITNVRTIGGWTGGVPTENSQENLRRVTVSPRDVFQMTWALAEKESSLPADTARASAILLFSDQNNKYTCECESEWAVSYYYYPTLILTFYIDAQTGQIVSMEKKTW